LIKLQQTNSKNSSTDLITNFSLPDVPFKGTSGFIYIKIIL
jgi:hypothetical protein